MLRPLSALGAALLLVLATLTVGTPASADRPDQLPAQASDRASDRAHQALARAEKLFAGGRDRGHEKSSTPEHAHGREATLVLRDLALALPRLTGEDHERAEAILARPTSKNPTWEDKYREGATVHDECADDVCVHWVETKDHGPRAVDDDNNGIPDYVDEVLSTLQRVHDTYAAAGYSPPLSDGARGGDSRTDIYLADVGDEQLYGYCVPERARGHQYTYQAYCVLDNDYTASQYGTAHQPLDLMRATAAHEYFHAVQFAHDATEDSWFMEATATWAEDEVYDHINDNRQYLDDSPLTRPRRPLDSNVGMGVYGDWIFFRYLTERQTASEGGMPTLVRDMWRRADATGRDNYSLQAVRGELAARGMNWPRTFTRFAEAGRRSRHVYDEGREQSYPVAPLAKRRTFAPKRRAFAWEGRTNHLSSAHFRFVPGRQLTHRLWKARIQLDMAPKRRGSAAIVTIHRKSKGTSTQVVRLNRKGDGTVRVPLSRRKVKAIGLTLVNTSTRAKGCWIGGPYSCQGRSRDDRLLQRIRVTAFR